MMEIRIPKPDKNDPLFKKLAKYAAQLICTTKEFDEIKNELKIKNVAVDKYERNEIESKINALSAKICGITKEELNYILTSSFPAVDEELKQKTSVNFDKKNY